MYKREFTKIALDKNSETFVMHIAALEILTTMPIYSSKAFQIQDNFILAALGWNKASTEILAKYSDYAVVFSLYLAMKLLENMGINKYAIKLINRKQPHYRPIYAFIPIKL